MIIQKTAEEKAYLKKVGENIRKFREEKRFARQDISEAVGYKVPFSILLIESGKVEGLDIVILQRIAKALEVPLSKIMRVV